MLALVSQTLGNLIKWAIYFAIIGEITTAGLKVKAGKSVQTGLINLKTLNQSLHSKQPTN